MSILHHPDKRGLRLLAHTVCPRTFAAVPMLMTVWGFSYV